MANTNELSEATSPYLLQHKDNPVHWVEWSQEAFQRAEKEHKLVLVSIGYSACHWCHVMEHESFEDESVASLMNEHFVCIKVDREERPDVDQVYMNAVQLMTQQGGWPLNCFTLPDGRPIYGGTYFPKEQWKKVLVNLWETYIQEPEKVNDYATKLTEGVRVSEMIENQEEKDSFDTHVLDQLVAKWKRNFDFDEGGDNRAPKFPLPNNYEFLLQYGSIRDDKTVINHVSKTLKKMARGGIYDQIGGGFARYSVDTHWKVPHFEKMLYDNAQLLSLYSAAFRFSKDPEFQKVLKQTIDWLDREMHDHKKGGYYSALDADSEGVEGKFYTWTEDELQDLLPDDFEWVKQYFNINQTGYWENGQYILLRKNSPIEYAEGNGINIEDFQKRIIKVENKLLKVRAERVPPGLDHKKITSWNALLLKGLIDAGIALSDSNIIDKAQALAKWLKKERWDESRNKLLRVDSKKGGHIDGFLDDYAHLIEAYIHLYEYTHEVDYLSFAHQLTERSIELFGDDKTQLFFYTEENAELLARKMEINDNVIPSSNSVMAKNLFRLGVFYSETGYTKRSRQMLSNIYEQMPQYGSGYSNWGQLAMYFTDSFKEVAIVGQSAMKESSGFHPYYLPNTLYAVSKTENIPFLKGRYKEGKTLYYVCKDQHCEAPVDNFDEAFTILKEA